MSHWSSVPPSPQRYLKDSRTTQRQISSDDSVFTSVPGRHQDQYGRERHAIQRLPDYGVLPGDKAISYHGGYVVDHLITLTIKEGEDVATAPNKAIQQLRSLDRRPGGITPVRCSIDVTHTHMEVLDSLTGEVNEQFPLELVDTPFVCISDPRDDVYNNILLFSVLEQRRRELIPYEMLVFHVLGCPARDVAEAIVRGQEQGGRPAAMVQSSAAETSRYSRTGSDRVAGSSNRTWNVKNESTTNDNGRQQHHTNSSRMQPIPQKDMSAENVEKYVTLLNRTFDDIEQFVMLLIAIQKEHRGKQRMKKPPSGGLLAVLTPMPSPEEYFDILQKFKLGFNLLAFLQTDINEPNAPELLHFLFGPLSLILAAIEDVSLNRKAVTANVISPLLTLEAVELLTNCLSSKEVELWTSLGESWTLSRDDWDPLMVETYIPKFRDGWEPPRSWMKWMNSPAISTSRTALRPMAMASLAYSSPRKPKRNDDDMQRRETSDQKDERSRDSNSGPFTRIRLNPSSQDVSGDSAASDSSGGMVDSSRHKVNKNRPQKSVPTQALATSSGKTKKAGKEKPHSKAAPPSRDDQWLLQEPSTSERMQQSLENEERQQPSGKEQLRQRFLTNLQAEGAKICEVIAYHQSGNTKEMTVTTGEVVEILEDSRKWWLCRKATGEVGYVPYVVLQKYYDDENGSLDKVQDSGVHTWETVPPPPPMFVPPPPPPNPPPLQGLMNSKSVAKSNGNKGKSAATTNSKEDHVRQDFDAELKQHLSAFRKGNWGNGQRALRASLSTIDVRSSAKDVRKWLDIKGFSEQTKYTLKSHTGRDMFEMSSSELFQLLGNEEGGRLENQLSLLKSAPGYAHGPQPGLKSIQQDGRKGWEGAELPIDY